MSASTLDIVQVGGTNPGTGAIKYNVAASATLIYPGEIVERALGGIVVTKLSTSSPVVGTDYVVGIATTTSTNTASAAGYVYVQPIVPGQIYSALPTVAASWNTQSEYDALVGKRVIFTLTTSTYTIDATDNSTYGCIVMAKNVNEDPGRVWFQFKWSTTDMYAAG